MKLTRLRLLGFKSFVEPTDFLIEPGLTGVVGPNGCGKSNLVEALRWVMGESSYKSMRASSMDDVIFSGNTSRPARNNAEVGIAIDNTDRSAPAAFNDQESIDIARRIERESGSTYRINGREVRARDVQILFADASTGARSPALVHQGRIGEIIQAKPEQRRRVLEEAAGVAGLHARRHEAELRLKAAESNLLRLEDVIGQLASQMDGLKKQARQAVRYRTVSAQVRKNEATLYHLRWSAAGIEVRRRRERQGRLPAHRRRAHGRTGGSLETAGDRASRAPRIARRGSARRRRLEPHQCRHGRARARRTARARPADRARDADHTIRRRPRARAEARRRRAGSARPHRRGRRDHPPRGTRQRQPPQRRRSQGGRGRRRAERGRKGVLRPDRQARRPHRAPQPARRRRAPAHRARRQARCRTRRNRAGARYVAGERRPRPRRALRGGRCRPGCGRRRRYCRRRCRGRPHRGAPEARSRARAAQRHRTQGAAAGDRGQDALEGAGGRDQEHVAAGDGQHHGREGIREGAGRRAWRRSRCADRSVGAHALDGLGSRSGRSETA